MVCKIIFCSEFPNIPDKADRKTTRRRRQGIAKRYAFHANAIRRRTQTIGKRFSFYANAKTRAIAKRCAFHAKAITMLTIT